MDLSIVVTTYNRARVLERLLATFDAQPDRSFQVVVAIDGSTDDTEAMLAAVRPGYDLKWINTHCPGYGLAVARNQGILAADGKVVVVLDDDSVPAAGFAAAHLAAARPGVITGGPRTPSDPSEERMMWKMRKLAELPPLTPMTIARLRRDWPEVYLVENNISLLREDWIGMGLFSERLKVYGFIGQEFFGRAQFLNMTYQYCPEAAIVHHGEVEGDNGLLRSRKTREAKLAGFVRPTLMTPRHYEAQIAWAKARAAGAPDVTLPPYRLEAAMALPWRALGAATAAPRRRLRALLKR